MNIHKEGFKIIPVAFLLLFGLYVLLHYLIGIKEVLYFIVLGEVIFFALIVRFFRNPTPVTEKDESVIYAPADGKVVVIEEVFEEEYLKKTCLQISVFMSPLNVHVNRSPVAGCISYFCYHPGKFLVAWHPKSSTKNERTSIAIRMKNDVELLMRQIAGTVARRIAFYIQPDDEVSQGGEVGFIRFGSRVDLFLPTDVKLKIKIGDLTKGGVTPLAILDKNNFTQQKS